MYYRDITNEELLMFHKVIVPNFTITLTDMLTSALFKVETIATNSIYRICPLFYSNQITSSNSNDQIIDNQVIICQKTDNETYITFISDETKPIQDYSNYASYFDLQDKLTMAEYNNIVSLLRQNVTHTEDIRIKEEINGTYGKYLFDIDGCVIVDNGILVNSETVSAGLSVKLIDPIFHQSSYVLKLTVVHFTDVNVLDDVTDNYKVVDTLEINLVKDTWTTIPVNTLTDGSVICFDSIIEINHTQTELNGIFDLEVCSPTPIIQSGESADLYCQLKNYDGSNYDLYDASGKTVYFYEVLTPTLTTYAEPSIIQSGDSTDIYSKVKDEDGSLVVNEEVYFYQPSILESDLNSNTEFIELDEGKGSAEYTENGIVRCKGYVIDDYFENTENWEMEFTYNYASGMRYTGLICLADYDNPSTYIGSWESGEILGLASDLPSGASIYDNPIVTDWITLHIRKTGSTTLELWKNNDKANKVSYTWNALSSINKLTIGGRTNNANVTVSNQHGSIYSKNWRVKQ